MTKFKILYLPTNKFLTDHEDSGIVIMMFDTIKDPDIIKDILQVNVHKYDHWRKHNNIVLPLLAEELEIIYD